MLHAQTHPHLDVDGCFGCKVTGVRLGGLSRLKQERRLGMTQSEIGRENVERFRKDNPGKEPYSYKEYYG